MIAEVVGDISERIISCFEWRIPKFWTKTNYFRSPTFQFWDATWKIDILYNEEISFRVVRDAWEQDSQVVAFKLSALKNNRTEYTIFESKFEFTEDKYEAVSSLTEEELLNNKLTPDGSLTIFCVFCGNRSIANAESMSSEHGQKRIEEKDGSMKKDDTIGDDVTEKCPKLRGVDKLVKDLKNLLVTEEDSDVCIKVKDRQFKAHKNILRVRSSVFYSMFKHDMAEKNSGIVEIVDCDPEAFQNFLRYLYTGYVEDLSNDTVVQLYRVADKYDAEEVKTKCAEFMTKNLSVETFCDVVALALEHNESALLETTTKFFCKNIREIIVTVQWQCFLKENSVAANELHVKALDYYVIRKK